MPFSQLPALLSAWLGDIAAALDPRSAPRLLALFVGALFARGRRTVTSWSRAAGIAAAFRPAYGSLRAAGRRAEALAYRLLGRLRQPLRDRLPGDHSLFGRDDTPTARYGPHVQGASVHHNPTPGPAGEQFVYGHVWVTLAWLVRHPRWDTLALPLRALLHVRAKDVPRLAEASPGEFRTQRQLAAELVRWLTVWLGRTPKALWLAVDGAYAKKPFLKPVRALGLVVVGRLGKDAALRGLPPTVRRRGPRRPLPTCGQDKIDLAKRAGQKRGWQPVECVPYGEQVVKTIKTFEATGRPAGGRVRVVLGREPASGRAYFCTDPSVTAAAIGEAMADRGAIEQTFKDVKEVWGAGQQQVRTVYASVGAFAVNLTRYSVVEAWAGSEADLVGRPPWDEEERRPSHADKRKALQREILREEIRAVPGERAEAEEFQDFTLRLLDLAA